jgi:hypothetical protein
MTEVLLGEIEKKIHDDCKNAESYALAAGFALGLVTLGKV